MGCSLHQAVGLDRPSRISVNGVTIAREAIAREAQNHPAEKPIAAWQEAARALVIRELLLQEARRLEIVAEPQSDGEGRRETEDEALIRQVIEREVRTPEADEATCLRYYEQNRSRFRSADLCEVRHILVAAAPGAAQARMAARQQATRMIEILQREPARFGELAQAHSACPSGRTGGSLGQIGPGQTVPEFERALATMPVAEVSAEPVETRYGLHIVLVERRIEGRELPFDLVRDRIRDWLAERVERTALAQYLSILAGRAEIKGIALSGVSSPLVQ